MNQTEIRKADTKLNDKTIDDEFKPFSLVVTEEVKEQPRKK
jgi:hypothetical protein